MTLAGDLLNCIVLILAVMGIVSAIQGQKKKLPVIGRIQLIR